MQKTLFPATVTPESIQNDMRDRPPWLLSCYGPAKDTVNLVGNVDMSYEEARMVAYQEQRTTGSIQQYVRRQTCTFKGVILV